MPGEKRAAADAKIYVLAAILGISAGILEVALGDLLLTALFVLVSTLLLGALRPERPWRWIVVVGVSVPAVQLVAYLFFGQKPYAAEVYESCLGFLTGIAGAYGGSVVRRGISELFRK
jgi:hypothetical protein